MKTRWCLFGLRVGLGIIFIAASIGKLASQAQFINEVAGYGLLPYVVAKVYGVALPWVELFAGCSLVLGIFTILALVLCLLMTLSFVIANVCALSQGMSNDCGCFGQLIPLSHSTSVSINVLMIVTAVVLLFYRKKTTFLSVGILISKFGSSMPKIPDYLAQKASQVILLAAIMLAIGLPLASGSTTSHVYSKIDGCLEQGKPVFLFFYLEGCGECEKQKPIIDDLERQYQGKICFIRLDYKAESKATVEFEVAGVPAMLLIDNKTDSGYRVRQRFPSLTSRDKLQHSFYETLGMPISYEYGPIAKFSATPTTGHVPAKVKFTDMSTGVINSWAWDFDNDGVVDSTLQHPQYTYTEPGTYTVKLTVSGPDGSSVEKKWGYLRFITSGCRADFFAESTSVSGVTPIQFIDRSEGEITSWEWDFDFDGVSTIDSTERNPTHTYTVDGVYSVSLTIRTPNCRDTLTRYKYITVTGCSH